MSFKQVKFGTGEEIFETIITDGSGKRLDKWKVMKDDFLDVVEILKKKFGLKRKEQKDLDWLK